MWLQEYHIENSHTSISPLLLHRLASLLYTTSTSTIDLLDKKHKVKDTDGQSFAAVEELEAISTTPFLNRTGDAEAYLSLVAPHMLRSHTTWHANADMDVVKLVEDVHVNSTSSQYGVLDPRQSFSQLLSRLRSEAAR